MFSRLGKLSRSARCFSTGKPTERSNSTVAMYLIAIAIAGGGLGYASAPLYRMFCQVTGFGGTTQRVNTHRQDDKRFEVDEEELKKREEHMIRVEFTTQTAPNIPWSFVPQQKWIDVYPGESALAFFKAKNRSDKPITGVATYNVVPLQMGLYFSKIQCFCFEEQRLQPGEEIDMPVLFYIEPEVMQDKRMKHTRNVVLGYTFFAVDDDETSEPEESK